VLVTPDPDSVVSGHTLLGLSAATVAQVAEARALVDGEAVGAPERSAPFSVVVDADRLTPGRRRLEVEVRYRDGTTARTPPVTVVASPRLPRRPVAGQPILKQGNLVLSGASRLAPGAVVIVGGQDRFPLEFKAGVPRVARASRGAASFLRIARALRRAGTATIVIRNPDGGTSEAVNVER
jgi:hypothetical protein